MRQQSTNLNEGNNNQFPPLMSSDVDDLKESFTQFIEDSILKEDPYVN